MWSVTVGGVILESAGRLRRADTRAPLVVLPADYRVDMAGVVIGNGFCLRRCRERRSESSAPFLSTEDVRVRLTENRVNAARSPRGPCLRGPAYVEGAARATISRAISHARLQGASRAAGAWHLPGVGRRCCRQGRPASRACRMPQCHRGPRDESRDRMRRGAA
jgi:hypothetical protein